MYIWYYRGISVTRSISRLYRRMIRDLLEQDYRQLGEEEKSTFWTDTRVQQMYSFTFKEIIEKNAIVHSYKRKKINSYNFYGL